MIYHILNGILISGNFLFSLINFGHLPEAIPEHYGGNGLPDRMVEATAINWFFLPVLSVFVTLLLYLSYLSKINPEKWNIFDEGEFKELPEENQNLFKVFAKNLITKTFTKMAVAMNMTFFLIQVTNYMAATGNVLKFHNYFVIVVMLLLLCIIGEFIFRFLRLKKCCTNKVTEA